MENIPLPNNNIECQNLIDSHLIAHHGYLRWRNALDKLVEKIPFKNWSKAYVLLHNGCMYIYKNELSTKPTKCSSLFGYTRCVSCANEVSLKVAWPFKMVHCMEGAQKSIYFSAPSERDMQKWIDIIVKELEKVNLRIASSPKPSPTIRQQKTNHVEEEEEEEEDEDESPNKTPTRPTRNNLALRVLKAEREDAEGGEDESRDEDVQIYNGGDAELYPTFEKVLNAGNFHEEFSLQDFFWKESPQDGEMLMKRITEAGAYMVRESSDESGLTLLLRTENAVAKYKIIKREGIFSLEKRGVEFDSLLDLVCYYKRNHLPNSEDKLTKPFSLCEY